MLFIGPKNLLLPCLRDGSRDKEGPSVSSLPQDDRRLPLPRALRGRASLNCVLDAPSSLTEVAGFRKPVGLRRRASETGEHYWTLRFGHCRLFIGHFCRVRVVTQSALHNPSGNRVENCRIADCRNGQHKAGFRQFINLQFFICPMQRGGSDRTARSN